MKNYESIIYKSLKVGYMMLQQEGLGEILYKSANVIKNVKDKVQKAYSYTQVGGPSITSAIYNKLSQKYNPSQQNNNSSQENK